MSSKIIVCFDVETFKHNNQYITYDISFSFYKYNPLNTGKFYKRFLRNRTIISPSNGKILQPLNHNKFIVEEFSHKIPKSKLSLYQSYVTKPFTEIIQLFVDKINKYKPIAIVGYNFATDIQSLKDTEQLLKSNLIKSSSLDQYELFRKYVCNSWTKAKKCDLYHYFVNMSPKFIKYQEKYANDNVLITCRKNLSRKLEDFYRFITNNRSYKQLHTGFNDNLILMECLEVSLKTDSRKRFPVNCMNHTTRPLSQLSFYKH